VTLDFLRRVTWWQALLVLLGTALLALGIVLLLAKLAGYGKIAEALRGADPRFVAVAPVAQALALTGYIAAFRALVRIDGGPRLSAWLATRAIFASLGATRLFAAAGAGGLAVAYWVLRRAGLERHDAVIRVLAFNAGVFGVFGLAVAAAGLSRLLGAAPEAPVAMAWAWLLGVAGCVAGALWVGSPKRRARLLRGAGRSRVRRGLADAVAAVAIVGRIALHPRGQETMVLGFCLYWTADFLSLWAGLRAFEVEVSLTALVLAYATGYVSIALPLPAGGLGGVDAAMTAALVAVGVPLAPALLGVLVYRFCGFVLPTVPAVAALSTLPLLGRELRAASRPPRTSS
jgi:uncharacterized membrane protein YbhN (UPF0104 family)